MGEEPSLRGVPDDELLDRLSDLTRQSRRVEADLVAHIGEVDVRRLYARRAVPSMFAYCTEVLRLSEAEAWLRILVARASREHPMLLAMLRDGRLHLSGIRRLTPHLTRANRQVLLERAVHRSRRQIEELIAEVAPRPDAPAGIRKLPGARGALPSLTGSARRLNGPLETDGAAAAPGPGVAAASPDARSATPTNSAIPDAVEDVASVSSPTGAPQLGPDPVGGRPAVSRPRQAQVEPLALERYKVQFTAGAELRDKLEHLQALMRASVPDGDLATLVELAVTEKIERLEAQRFARTKTPRKRLAEADTTPSSRHIPAPVRRAVYERDEGRCTYVDALGKRCASRERLEFHHRRPFGRGGEHSMENLALTCRAHNALLAEIDFGKEELARYRRSGQSSRSTSLASESTAAHAPAGREERNRSHRLASPGRSP